MKALVTGANGFLGRHVVCALLARGIEVRAMVRPAARLEGLDWPSSVEVFRADLRTTRDLPRAFEGVDVLLHLAAVVSGGEDAQFAGTVAGTERLLEAMAAAACQRLVLCSTFSVYNYSAISGTLYEDSPLHQTPDLYARDGYTIAKWWQERVTRRFAEKYRLGSYRAPAWVHLGTRSRLPRCPRPAVRAAPPGHRSADAHTNDPRRELRRRLCAGGGGWARSRPDLERGGRSRRTHLDLLFRLPARQRQPGLAPARALLACHPDGAVGLRHGVQDRHQGTRHPHPAPVRSHDSNHCGSRTTSCVKRWDGPRRSTTSSAWRGPTVPRRPPQPGTYTEPH